jgi:hypothetical protein
MNFVYVLFTCLSVKTVLSFLHIKYNKYHPFFKYSSPSTNHFKLADNRKYYPISRYEYEKMLRRLNSDNSTAIMGDDERYHPFFSKNRNDSSNNTAEIRIILSNNIFGIEIPIRKDDFQPNINDDENTCFTFRNRNLITTIYLHLTMAPDGGITRTTSRP